MLGPVGNKIREKKIKIIRIITARYKSKNLVYTDWARADNRVDIMYMYISTRISGVSSLMARARGKVQLRL